MSIPSSTLGDQFDGNYHRNAPKMSKSLAKFSKTFPVKHMGAQGNVLWILTSLATENQQEIAFIKLLLNFTSFRILISETLHLSIFKDQC